ncbi:hypothetical protein L2E82_40184 [Cichorium intybus]|uniref:Uncharacterized protein n=1 Tax=Cichorium intybus TaxID=13427 RepID=A0ACB9AK37_CICIN|nr:hypothetical protein L2E82_40184 [Cichorium intybus]
MADPMVSPVKKKKIWVVLRVSWGGSASDWDCSVRDLRHDFVAVMLVVFKRRNPSHLFRSDNVWSYTDGGVVETVACCSGGGKGSEGGIEICFVGGVSRESANGFAPDKREIVYLAGGETKKLQEN